MPSLGSILEIAKTGLVAQQQAMNVVAHNIANASTEGYSRQRAEMSGMPSLHLPGGVYGTGVKVDDVARIADPLLDGAFYRELTGASEQDTRASILQRVEGLFGEPSDTGLGAALDAFFSAWSDLATNPGSTTVRASVRQAATTVAQKLGDLTAGLDSVRQEVELRTQSGVDRANSLLDSIARLNREIVSQEAGGSTAGDLRDERARRLTELSELLPIQVYERENGSIGVTSSGYGIVDGVEHATLVVRQTAGVWGLAEVGGASTFSQVGGSLGGYLDLLNTDLPAVRQELDDLAAGLVAEVNAIHQTGTNPAGNTGIDFFDPAGTTASSLALSADVLAGVDAIAAGTPDGLGAYRAGANDIALQLAGLRDTDVPSLGASLGEHYDGLVFDVAQGVRNATDTAHVHRTLADQADVRRASLSGVSVDEELVKMIQFQTAYQAAARVVTTADQMMQSLLAI
jgi:flagellar hook-associated protein 1 FlgK